MQGTTRTRALAPDLWAVEFFTQARGLHLRMRMTVARLPGNRLWLHSPVPIDDAVATWLAELGEVAYVVAPSRFHYLFAGKAAARYPQAELWLAPGLRKKCPHLESDHTLAAEGMPWADQLHTEPMAGAPVHQEVVFFHRASASLICTDFLFNIREEPRWLTRMLYRLLGIYRVFGNGRLWRLLSRDKTALAGSVARILSWDPQRIVMAHGDVAEGQCEERIRAACYWLPLQAALTAG